MPPEPALDVEPLDVTGTWTVALGTVAWAVAFVVLLLFRGRLDDSGNSDWLWTCLAGVGLGIFGWALCSRRARKLRVSR